ncbi:M14 family zinc carboxypeptidase [Acidobacteriota bacterium]
MVKKLCLMCMLLTLLVINLPAQQFQTPAEKENYQQGGTKYDQLMEFIYELESKSELMNVQKITETLMGRDLVLCILSNPPVFSPADIDKSGKPVVLIVNNVHGGEVAGKDASLEIMRDLVLGDLKPLLEKAVVLNIPTLNPDGAEVRRRTNEQRFDMNRDYIKLESQEIFGLVTQVINKWHPDIHIDTHHGGSDPYVITYQTCMNPAGDEDLIRFGNEEILPRVRAALQAEDYDGFWYSGGRWVDGEAQWRPTSVELRKQHVYSTMANMVGFLFETPRNSNRVTDNGTKVVPIPQEERFQHQVRGQYIAQREMIRFAAERGDDLQGVIAGAKSRAIALGNNDSDNDQIPLEYEQVKKFDEEFWMRKEGDRTGPYEKTKGGIYTKFDPTKTATRPWGYLLPPELAHILPLLFDHEITVKRLTNETEVEVEAYYAKEINHPQYYQGHYLKQLKAEKKTETIKLPVGSFFIPAGQQKSNFICYILEPETDDNLITWGFLDDFISVTTGQLDQLEEQEAQFKEQMEDMSQEEKDRMQERLERQRDRITNQPIPIYRLMKKTPLKGVLVEPFNEVEKKRYIKYR